MLNLLPRPASRFARLAAHLAVAICLVMTVTVASAFAATNRERSNEYYEDARAYLERGDLNGAVIQLKNALQNDPDNLAARYLLGEIYVRVGDGASAEKELLKARDRGLDEARVIIPLGRAYLLQGKYEAVLDEIRSGDREGEIEAAVLLTRGQAYLGLDRIDEAETALQEAARMRPDDPRAKLALARVFVTQGNIAAAEEQADRALALAPRSADAWVLKGELTRLNRDLDAAVAYFDKAIDIDPGSLPGRLGRAASLIDLNRDDDAMADIRAVQDMLPNHPLGLYLSALVAAKRRDFQAAEDALLQVVRYVDDHLPSIFLLGAVNYAQNEPEQAEANLTRYLERVPDHPAARKLLGATLIRKNDAEKAIKVLLPVLELVPGDPQTLALLGSAYMQNRQYAESTAYFEKAAAAAPETAAIRTQLALSRMAVGEAEVALEDLESAFGLDPDATQAGILLALAQLRNRNFDAVLAAVAELEKRMPDNPLTLNLRGAAMIGKNDFGEARRSFEKALEIQPDYFPAGMNLAQLDLREGESERASERYQSIIARDSAHVGALVALADLALRENRADDAISWLEQARSKNPRAGAPRLRLVNIYLGRRESGKALGVARELEQIGGENPQALDALARAQLGAGEANSAVATYRRIIRLNPKSAEIYQRLATAQVAVEDIAGARESLQTARSIDPGYLPARVAAVELELRANRTDEALTLAAALREERPDSAVGDMLTGDVLMRAGKFSQAADAYAKAMTKEESAVLAVRQYNARVGAGDVDAALEPLEDWVAANPDDRGTRFVLASAYLKARRFEPAIEHHEHLLAEDPENPVVLNNLAWAYQEVGDPRALSYAEKAHERAPQSTAITDTLGWILVRQGKASRGLVLLKQASAQAPQAWEIRYHLAVALSETGRREEARRELEAIVKSGTAFDGLDDARARLRALTGE
ncbi:MAG: XrtA/PEP-CTERM system TPR-repeat protein PrsT [Alphaproteobacteria bacterium]